ncbi:MAG: methionyl-tRNA formyltransferase [Phycisphaerales bacterium]|nr:MAG: methionyl-tRNA formyltransferase [Phycisphaerales bacterium]
MRMLFVGSGDFAGPTLHYLAREHEVATVVTQPARKAGRGRSLRPTAVRALAEQYGIPLIEAEDVNAPPIVAQLSATGAELGVVVAFGQKLGPELLASVPAGFINLHASLLPKYRGAAPYQWAVINGEEKAGVTVFRLTSVMDAGPILTQRWTSIKPAETAAELHDRLAHIGPDAMRAAVDEFADGRIPEGQPQDPAEVTQAPKLKKKDGAVDFSRPADQLAHFVCGMWSWPGASCAFESKDGRKQERVILARARVGDPGPAGISPGELDARLFIATAGAWLELLEIKPAAGRVMTWQEYVNGRHVKPGDRFVTITS